MDGMTAHPGINGIAQVALGVRDLGRATAFYRDVLGLKMLFEAPGMAFFDAGGVRLLLGDPSAGGTPGGGTIVYFAVPDVRPAAEALGRRGAAVRQEPHCVAKTAEREVWVAFLEDPEGNTFALLSEASAG